MLLICKNKEILRTGFHYDWEESLYTCMLNVGFSSAADIVLVNLLIWLVNKVVGTVVVHTSSRSSPGHLQVIQVHVYYVH